MNCRILVVEDNLDTQRMVAEFLEMKEFQIFTADDGLEALEVLSKETVDIVLTDIRMPRMDGFELIRNIKEKYPRLGVIIMTAFTSIYTEGSILETKADDYITKPFGLDDLKDKIDRIFLQISLLKEKKSD